MTKVIPLIKSNVYFIQSLGAPSLCRVVQILLAVAIISILIVMSVFACSYIEYRINNYETFSIILFNSHGDKSSHPVEAKFIPDGFKLSDSDENNSVSMKE